MRIYLANPLGFSEAGKQFLSELIRDLCVLGHEVINPWSLIEPEKVRFVQNIPYGLDKRDAYRKLNEEMGRINCNEIDLCDLVFAVLDGPDVDSGTASEIGYAYAKGKPIIGYRGDIRQAGENEGAMVNLQVEYFIRQSGGDIITQRKAIPLAISSIKIADKKRPIE